MTETRDDLESPEATSPEEWGRRLRQGDAQAVQYVGERVRRILAHHRIGIPSHEQDDLKQDIMTELWRAVNRSGFDFTAGFWGFVEVVTSRRCIDWLRSRREGTQVPKDLPDSGGSPLESALAGERVELATRVMKGLDSNCQEIINLRMRDGLSYREIARKLGKNEGALRVQFYRCVKNAQQILTNMNPDSIGIKE